MNKKNIVIGIEGLVGAGKTSISRELLKYIPNSIIIHGGNIYRAIAFGIVKSGLGLEELTKIMNNEDVLEMMEKLNIEVRLEDRETVIYIKNQKMEEKDLQAAFVSLAVSKLSSVADNTRLYKFGKDLINTFRKDYNVILSSRDIMKMYPEVTYHLFITASLEERVNRKYIQYNEILPKEKIKENILMRDDIQERSGFYKKYDNTIVIDVTNCKSVEESTNEVLKYIKLEALV